MELEEPARDVVFLTQKEDPTRARRRGHTEHRFWLLCGEAEGGTTGVDVRLQVGISEQTFYRWKRKYAGLASVNCANCGSSVMRMPS